LYPKEPQQLSRKKDLFKTNLQMWNSQSSKEFSRANLQSPSFKESLHSRPFGFFSKKSVGPKGRVPAQENSCFQMEATCTRAFHPKHSQFLQETEEDEEETSVVDEHEAALIKKEKVMWKHR